MAETYTDDPLWHEIENFRLDQDDATLPFSARLARENRWPHDYALKVIDEYKRFIYLMCRAGHPVTPSVEVDQAWHLHMLYTRSYWQDLAPRLPIEPHHGPTEGGPREGKKFTDWYQKTLEAYRRLFGTPAPLHIWPPPRLRFAGDQQLVFVDAGKVYMLPKRIVHEIVIPFCILALLAIGWLLA